MVETDHLHVSRFIKAIGLQYRSPRASNAPVDTPSAYKTTVTNSNMTMNLLTGLLVGLMLPQDQSFPFRSFTFRK